MGEVDMKSFDPQEFRLFQQIGSCSQHFNEDFIFSEESMNVETPQILDKGLMEYGCLHYRRRCSIRAPCCNEVFDCRHCHNEVKNNINVDQKHRHDMPRHEVKQVICSLCGTEQEVQQVCINCGVCMGKYFCEACKLFDDDDSAYLFCLKPSLCYIVHFALADGEHGRNSSQHYVIALGYSKVIKKDHVAAGLCCIQLFMNSFSQEEAVKHLENAKMHFDEGLSARYKGGDSTKVVTKGVRGKSASEKLTEEGLVKFSARVSIQVEVVKSSNDSDGPQWKHSLFGNPNDPETFRRRCEIAETLVEKNFDLAFQIIYEFNLPAVDIYAGVAASLAERKRGSQLTEFFRNIKGTIDDDDWDQVLGAAINIYANKHKERPDRLIGMLTSSHRKVLACVVCGRLKSAFQIASRSGSVADVQYVAHQSVNYDAKYALAGFLVLFSDESSCLLRIAAKLCLREALSLALHANALPVLDMCKQWLAQYM
ncbi:hypothetical protein NC651_015947 [Populus alba x Populus x berolinensis]|nr:hypothetical protein NC651_015947 [Populus alba x Populus x berolinensis]